ncbi:MAG TPA: 50S ribosomal protein L11 methyltransferase [Thermoanaerobaculaceae bacterium]|nr:50S ribosomal protein L11 methyltransferase [Thermoanaerobaculaceae bacterium]
MYSVAAFGEMIADRIRTDAYVRALRQTVRPDADTVVLDLGTGTGILALISCQCGARRVYAVDTSGAVQVAREAIRDNGFADRVVVIQNRSTEIALPERADVIVSDLRGVLPPLGSNIGSLIDARDRFLATGGSLIPQFDRIYAAVVELPTQHEKMLAPWTAEPLGLNLRSGLRFVQNSWVKLRVPASQLLSPPGMWAELDYASLQTTRVHGTGELPIHRKGVANGLLLWFETELSPGIGFSSAPGSPEVVYGQAFFPWPETVPVRDNDVVAFDIRADFVRDDYVWTWNSEVQRGSNRRVDARFHQSTFLGSPLSEESLAKRSPRRVPGLNNDGAIVRDVLERMGTGASLGEIARVLHQDHPARFRSWQDALDFASDISSRYGG